MRKGHPVTIGVNYRRFVRLYDKERTPEQVHNDAIVVNEALEMLNKITAVISDCGNANGTVVTATRNVKIAVNPGKRDGRS